MVQRVHGGAASSARRSNAEAAARICAVVVKESRVRGRSWGHFKGGAGGLGMRHPPNHPNMFHVSRRTI